MTTLRQTITADIESKQVQINALAAEVSALQAKLANADSKFAQFLENEVEDVRGWFVSVGQHLKNVVESA